MATGRKPRTIYHRIRGGSRRNHHIGSLHSLASTTHGTHIDIEQAGHLLAKDLTLVLTAAVDVDNLNRAHLADTHKLGHSLFARANQGNHRGIGTSHRTG